MRFNRFTTQRIFRFTQVSKRSFGRNYNMRTGFEKNGIPKETINTGYQC